MSLGATPPGEVAIDSSLVGELLREQHSDLAHLALVDVGEGWDNRLFRLGTPSPSACRGARPQHTSSKTNSGGFPYWRRDYRRRFPSQFASAVLGADFPGPGALSGG